MCDLPKKKYKRSFQESWLNNDQCKNWIRKVSSDDSLFHCTVCNKDFSCNTYILKHANSVIHKNNITKETSLLNNEISSNKKVSKKYKFQQQWL